MTDVSNNSLMMDNQLINTELLNLYLIHHTHIMYVDSTTCAIMTNEVLCTLMLDQKTWNKESFSHTLITTILKWYDRS